MIGIASLAIVNSVTGSKNQWEDYLGAFVGGAIMGEALLYTGPVIAGICGSALGNLTSQLTKKFSQKRKCDFIEYGVSIVVGGFTGAIPGLQVKGITSGRGSFNFIFKKFVTHAQTGTAKKIMLTTGIKMVVGRFIDTAVAEGAIVGNVSSIAVSSLRDEFSQYSNNEGPAQINSHYRNRYYYFYWHSYIHTTTGKKVKIYDDQYFYAQELPPIAEKPVIKTMYLTQGYRE